MHQYRYLELLYVVGHLEDVGLHRPDVGLRAAAAAAGTRSSGRSRPRCCATAQVLFAERYVGLGSSSHLASHCFVCRILRLTNLVAHELGVACRGSQRGMLCRRIDDSLAVVLAKVWQQMGIRGLSVMLPLSSGVSVSERCCVAEEVWPTRVRSSQSVKFRTNLGQAGPGAGRWALSPI